MHISRCFFALSAFLLATAARATPWSAGDEVTYTQQDWAVGGSAYLLLAGQFDNVYPTAVVAVGELVGGQALIFENPAAISSFLPASGPDRSLSTTLIDPTSSPAGDFGGEVLALRLNVDFSDAGVTSAPGGPFGNLVIENLLAIPGVNGLTVRDVLSEAEVALGGGVTGSPISDLSPLAAALNSSFDNGAPSVFAQDFLVSPTSGGGTGVPEPSNLLLFVAGCLVLVGRRPIERLLGRSGRA